MISSPSSTASRPRTRSPTTTCSSKVGITRAMRLRCGGARSSSVPMPPGMALGVIARAARLPRLPIEIAAALPALDNLPPVRRALEHRRNVEAGVVSVAALLHGLSQGPVGLVVDAGHRVMLLREAGARRAAWERVEPRLYPGPRPARVVAFDRAPRPQPLPDGVVETYARARLAGIARGRRRRARGDAQSARRWPTSCSRRSRERLGWVARASAPSSAVASRAATSWSWTRGCCGDSTASTPWSSTNSCSSSRRRAADALVASIRGAAQDLVARGRWPGRMGRAGTRHGRRRRRRARGVGPATPRRRPRRGRRVVAAGSGPRGGRLWHRSDHVGPASALGRRRRVPRPCQQPPRWSTQPRWRGRRAAAPWRSRPAARRLAIVLAFGPVPGSGRRAMVADERGGTRRARRRRVDGSNAGQPPAAERRRPRRRVARTQHRRRDHVAPNRTGGSVARRRPGAANGRTIGRRVRASRRS